MVSFEEWKYINDCMNELPKKFQKEFFEEVLGFEQVEIDGLSFDIQSVRKNFEYYLDEICDELQ